jgi:hypothetical protein
LINVKSWLPAAGPVTNPCFINGLGAVVGVTPVGFVSNSLLIAANAITPPIILGILLTLSLP